MIVIYAEASFFLCISEDLVNLIRIESINTLKLCHKNAMNLTQLILSILFSFSINEKKKKNRDSIFANVSIIWYFLVFGELPPPHPHCRNRTAAVTFV